MRRERVAATLVLLPMVLVWGAIHWYGRSAVPGYGDDDVVVVNLTGVASTGVWTLDEVNGFNYWWKRFQPATVHLRQGDEVVLNLRSADLLHCFYIPALGVGPVDVEPGHLVTVRFTANTAGVFQYYCTSICGGCHFYMRGWIVVTAEGERAIDPPPILCGLCQPTDEPPPDGGGLVALGAFLYRTKGCMTCHGPEGMGGVPNLNSANSPVPRHDTTAQKLFLRTPEDCQRMVELVESHPDLAALEEEPDIVGFQVVRVRWENARQIIRGGRYSSKVDPRGPEPPLQMPAWQYLISEREMDAVLSYFISLYPWEDEAW